MCEQLTIQLRPCFSRRRSGDGKKPLAALPAGEEGEEEDDEEAGAAAASSPQGYRGAAPRAVTLLSADRVSAIIAKVALPGVFSAFVLRLHFSGRTAQDI